MFDLVINLGFFVSALFCNFLIVKYGLIFSKEPKSQIQNIHIDNTPRLGGLIIYIHFFLYVILVEKSLINFCIISLLFLIPAFYEDLNYNLNPLIRLFLILIGSFILVISLDQLPQFELIFNSFLNNNYFQIVFFTICLATIINGQNILDGSNGLSALTGIAIFGCLLYIGIYVKDDQIVKISIIVINLLLCFLLFNYPYGKIFLGDLGSYFIGLLSGYLTIYIFGKYNELPTWSAVVILYYPSQEVIFSYFRKIIKKKSPFLPDNLHLHLKVFFLLQSNKAPSKLFNALVAPFLSILWLSPLALIPFTLQNHSLSILAVLLLGFIYMFLYFAIPEPKN